MNKSMHAPVVVIPNLNGGYRLLAAVESLENQTLKPHIIVVDNASTDGSISQLRQKHGRVEIIQQIKNFGYAGGVNPGFKRSIELGAQYVAPFNNDAVADKNWLAQLVKALDDNERCGVAACKLLSANGARLDSSGESYTMWGLPFPRGRQETDLEAYDDLRNIFAASGGASLYRVATLQDVGLFDENFFAYYEDVDFSFRAQLAGWKIIYVPTSLARHATGSTGGKVTGFYTYQTHKNLPMLLVKNVPANLLPVILPRFILAYVFFMFAAIQRGEFWYALKGAVLALVFIPIKLAERRSIHKQRRVSVDYIRSMIYWDLPPNAARLRALRSRWWKLSRRKAA